MNTPRRTARAKPKRAACLGGFLTLALLPGCGIELAMVGAATTAGQSAFGVFRAGKLTVNRRQPMEGLQRAAEEARAALDLTFVDVRDHDPERWELKLKDDRNAHITIRLVRRTSIVTQVQVDVGPFGSRSMAQLVYAAMHRSLPPDEYAPADGGVALGSD
ncbi:MAG: DUF3568 family protein [Planctomycetota bacterium]